MAYVEDHEVSHVVDSHAGQYMPREFVATWGEFLYPQDAKMMLDVASCAAGPEDAFYCEAWCDIANNAEVRIPYGDETLIFTIHENEGIYLVRDGVEWCDECEWFKSADCDCPHV